MFVHIHKMYLYRFSIDILYEHALNILHYQATFQAMASHFQDFHLGMFKLHMKLNKLKLNKYKPNKYKLNKYKLNKYIVFLPFHI